MKDKKETVFVALSGGVDSLASAVLLKQKGYNCQGVFMITCDHFLAHQADAQKVADALEIKLHIVDFRKEFQEILDYFFDQYRAARTPNPCVYCNRLIKFGKLWDFAKDHGADYLATGHYAKLVKQDDNTYLYEAADTKKDQSYVFSMINRDILNNLILPMAEVTKEQAKQIAADLNLGIEHKEESQEICFVEDDDYARLIEENCPELVVEGDIIDSSGKVLGRHKGIHKYTIGQRRGLDIAMGVPYYVTHIDAEKHTVTIGPKNEVMKQKFSVSNLNWLTEPNPKPFRAKVKIRYNSKGQLANIYPKGQDADIEFDEPVSAITPGQAAVMYIPAELGSRLVAGGWIQEVE